MGFISWLVIAAIFMLAEFGSGAFYFFAVGVACLYPAYAAYLDASVGTQLLVLISGALVHALIVMSLRKIRAKTSPPPVPDDIGKRVEVIIWQDECTARVRYLDRDWQADKLDASMPDASFGIIKEVRGNRLLISTEETV